MKQIGLAFHNHHDTLNYFPNGGRNWQDYPTYSEDDFTNYSGHPETGYRQDAGWMFQILPYIEQTAIWEGGNLQGIARIRYPSQQAIGAYYCPSRRKAQPDLTGSAPQRRYRNRNVGRSGRVPIGKNDYAGCCYNGNWWDLRNRRTEFVNGRGTVVLDERATRPNGQPATTNAQIRDELGFEDLPAAADGVVIHVDQWNTSTWDKRNLTVAVLQDGTSSTLAVAEKRFSLGDVGGLPGYDNDSWISGWDWDVMRRGDWTPKRDRKDRRTPGARFGSSHPAGINAAFADGSVQFIPYGVDRVVFARLCHRLDGGTVDFP